MNFRSFAKNPSSVNSFDGIRVSLISPEDIVKKSHGEIRKPETINYRTFKPEKDGLFCQKIFGPVNNNECACGKYKRNNKYRGIVCEKCGVEVTDSFVRRSRIGHITLACPVVHIWFLKSMPSRISILLDMQLREIEMILYNNLYVVIEPGKTELERGALVEEDEYNQLAEENIGYGFVAMTGADAIHKMLSSMDLRELSATLRLELADTNSEIKKKKIVRRLRLVEDFVESKNRPEWMVVNVIPVLPPDLRPLVMLEAGRFASSDLNDLYRMLINRNNRLKKLIALSAPEIIIRNEKRMLQEAVDSFFDNSRRGKSAKSTGKNKRLLKSLSDGLKGKQGRFRQNLLGKRVDYSGRSVIVVGPHLKLHQCGLPKKIAVELFKPYLYRLVELYGMAPTLRGAKRYIEQDDRPEIVDLLQEIVKNHPVLLNRAPTLHRLGIQAFEIVLIDGKAIQLHPLTCTAFNADFDGDQMAVHVPLSIEAQLECYILMLSSHNLLSPSNGKPIVMPSKDMVLGCYYLTLMEEDENFAINHHNYSSITEINHAVLNGAISLHKKINFRIKDSTGAIEDFVTTPGRVILFDALKGKVPFAMANLVLNNKTLGELVSYIYKNCSKKDSAECVNEIKSIGFKYSTLSGISCSKNDMVIPMEKTELVNKSFKEVERFEQQFQDGLITADEKKNKIIDCWTKCGDSVFSAMMSGISKPVNDNGTIKDMRDLNSIYIMANSGARGSPAQIRQFAGMRGLMYKPSGEIIERPIVSNFREGLTVFEYFISTHGARKGLSDTALKTANSGYLTRRLVDVAMDCIVSEYDCGTQEGITISSLVEGNEVIDEFRDAIIGRIIAGDLIHPINGELILTDGSMIDESNVGKICEIFDNVKIRSPITCGLDHNICVKCYGRDLATGYMATIGDAVGIVAAQSIGEPGTQLTMRTFHVGGAASGGSESSSIEAAVDGVVKLLNVNAVINGEGDSIVISKIAEVIIYDANKKMRARHKIPHGSKIFVVDGLNVAKGTMIASWDSYSLPVIADVEGYIKYHDLEIGISYDEVVDEVTLVTNRIITDWRQKARNSDIKPALLLCDKKGDPLRLPNGMTAIYYLPVGTVLKVQNGEKVAVGDVISSMPKESSKARDITGGLPRIIEIFEARKPKDMAVISEIDGNIEFGKDYKAKRLILVRNPEDPELVREYFVPKGQHMIVNEGDFVKTGDLIVDGALNPHDVLNVMGLDGIARYIINEIQKVYRAQGVVINNKHIEIILKQMLHKVEIVDPGDSLYLYGEQIEMAKYKKLVEDYAVEDKIPPKVFRVLQGITRSSLDTESFISAAYFQETIRVLIDASILGKVDKLDGLKENVIVGRLIPAGTGLHMRKKKSMVMAELESKSVEETKIQDGIIMHEDLPIIESNEIVHLVDNANPNIENSLNG